MRKLIIVSLMLLLTACDSSRIYEKNHNFAKRWWVASEQPRFDFEIPDSSKPYNLYLNVRNESVYAFSNLYVTWHLLDSAGTELQQKLTTEFLFDKKTGKPLGKSGIGDIYDHRFPLLSNHRFPYTGRYALQFEHFMRTDTLKGVLAVGLRIEKPLAD
ncbi:MAG: gliding motility lipoprotein GldH [Cyclobacteriaceae bacterium]